MAKEIISIDKPIERIDIKAFKEIWDSLNVGPREGGFLLAPHNPEIHEALLNELGEEWQ